LPGIGGDFALTTAQGRSVTAASFAGKWLILYFGYTFCPDACPTALNAIAGALAELGPLAAKLQPLFITVDPKRDTPAVIGDYVKAFDPRMLGLYGNAEQTAGAARAFRVYYKIRPLGDGDYAIDHSSYIYIVDPAGHVVELLSGNVSGRALADLLRERIK
jgi:protein SCO1/2